MGDFGHASIAIAQTRQHWGEFLMLIRLKIATEMLMNAELPNQV